MLAPSSRRKPRRRLRYIAPAALLSLIIAGFVLASGTGCAAVVNSSPGFRWWLFSNFGAQRVCPEMVKTSVTLRLQDRAPGVGRFFPSRCSYDVNNDSQTLTVNVMGTGYAYLPTAKRISFNLNVSVEYRPDFQIAGDDLYVWGKFNRLVTPPNFQLVSIENKLMDIATIVTPLGTGANVLGNQVVASFLVRGFTVVDNSSSGRLFSLGILNPPAKPFQPVQVSGDSAYTFANEQIDVYQNQRDYLGPYEVADSDQQLQIKMNLVGSPVEMMVVTKATGDEWLDQYVRGLPLGPAPPPGAVADYPIQQGPFTQKLKLQPGFYYVVIDNTAAAGVVNPPFALPNPLVDPVSRLTYVAQLVED